MSEEPATTDNDTAKKEVPAQSTPATAGVKPSQDDARSDKDIELLLQQTQAAIDSVDQDPSAAAHAFQYKFNELKGTPASSEQTTIELLSDVELDLKIELGRTILSLEDILKLRKGSVVCLDKLAGDPVDIMANGRLIARGEVLVLNDNFCVRVAHLVTGSDV